MKKARWFLAALLFPGILSTSLPAQWRFDPAGYFYWSGEKPAGFADFGYLLLAPSSPEPAAPATSALIEISGTRFPMARLRTEWSAASGLQPFFAFNTAVVGGVHYVFDGRFLDNRVFAANVTDPRTVVAEGALGRYKDGRETSRAVARFTYYARPWDRDAELLFAAGRGDLPAVRSALAGGADARAFGPYGLSALEYGVASGRADVVAALLAAGADPDAELSQAAYDRHREGIADQGRTALIHAVSRKDGLEIVSLLVRAGARVDARDWRGAPVLRYALFGTPEIVSALILAGADVNAADDEGRTVLMEAASRGDAAVVRILLRAGARTDPRSLSGETALSIARLYKNAEIIKLLEEAETARNRRRPRPRYGMG
jgi:ankyrin repeat protein